MPKTANELQPIYSSPGEIGSATHKAMIDGIMSQFPVQSQSGKYKLELSDVFVDRKDFSHKDEKEAILASKSLTYPIRGTLRLVDTETGAVVDEAKKFNLANTYHVTNKHTILYNGNNYSVSNLILLRPGVYTRRKDNDEIEAQFNTGKGVNFNLGLNPTTMIISINKINKNSVSIPIAPILKRVFGLSDGEITKYIPADVWMENLKATAGKEERYIQALYSRMMSLPDQRKDVSDLERTTALRSRLEEHTLDKSTTAITLGKGFENVNAEALLRAIRNLIQLHKRERPEDNRDSLEFKRVQNLPDYIRRRFDPVKPSGSLRTAMRDVSRRLNMAANASKDEQSEPPRIRDMLRSKPFDKVFTEFITSSDLTSTPDETNPVESLENVGKTTVIAPGEGGIKDENSASPEARNVHASHLGILDPSRTPESSRAGLDQRFTVTARRDADGTLYSRMEDTKGNIVFLSANEMMSSIIGFPGQRTKKKKGDVVQAQDRGQFRNVKYEQVQYWVPSATDMYTITTNLVPFKNSNHPGRLTMAGKAIPQALSLVKREIPLVQTLDHNNRPFVDSVGQVVSTVAPISGTITAVTKTSITITSSDGKEKRTVDLVDNLPFNMKGFHHDEGHSFKIGDKVQAGQPLSDNNYTRQGKLALGTNLRAAYMPFKGYNHEDGIIVSRSAAEKLTSSHAYKYDYEINAATELSLNKFKAAFPSKFTPDQLSGLDEKGFPKKGTKLKYGDAIYAVLEKRETSETDRVLGRLHKTLVNPYRAKVEIWNHEEPGVVTDVFTGGKEVKIMVRSEKALEVGDKITGQHGNKGVVSLILDDEEMPHSKETGKAVDLLLNPASVTSRINLGQIMETAAAKIAEKTGKPYLVKDYEVEDNASRLQEELKKHGLKDTETIYDPKTGKVYSDNVFAGPQYILKLNKTTDANYSARSVGRYDNNAQPGKGGDEGSKSIGYMEFLGLLGSDARQNLKEIATIKSEGGDLTDSTEYWTRFMKGQMLPPVKTTFATRKFFDYLKGSGIKVTQDSQKGELRLSPMTDVDILAQSRGEVKDGTMLHKMKPEKGGLFDFATTGGPEGRLWSHYSLAEPIVNPTLESPVKSILGLNQNEFDNLTSGKYGVVNHNDGQYSLVDNFSEDDEGNVKVLRRINTRQGFNKSAAKEQEVVNTLEHDVVVGGAAIKDMLNSIEVDAEIEGLKKEILTTKSVTKRNAMVKRLKYLSGLKGQGFDKIGDASVIQNIPVLPPIMRPYSIQGNGVKYADVNQMYKHHLLVNNKLKQTHNDYKGMVEPTLMGVADARRDLYEGARAIMSSGEAIEFTDRQRGVKSLMTQISGQGSPKHGFFHKMLLSRKQDFSGRGTIYADPDLDFNEARIPKEQLWTMYEMHILRELSKRGFDLAAAKKAYKERTPAAMQAFNKLIKEVPVMLNRAPTLMRTNIMAIMPVPTEGKTIGLNPLHLPAYAADYDGDAMSMFVPVTPGAIQEAKEKMLPSRHLHDARQGYGNPMFAPGHEAILGSVHLTRPDMTKEVVKFKTEKEALDALNSGSITEDTPIEIVGG